MASRLERSSSLLGPVGLAFVAGLAGAQVDVDPPTVPAGLSARSWHLFGPGECGGLTLTWEPSQDGGSGVSHYRVWCEGRLSRWSAVTGTRASAWPHAIVPGMRTTWQVSAVDRQGNESALSEPLVFEAPWCLPHESHGSVPTAVLLVRFEDFPGTPFSASQADAAVFGAQGSLREWYAQVSGGRTAIVGDVFDWVTIGRARQYCRRSDPANEGYWYDCALSTIQAAAEEAAGLVRNGRHERFVYYVHGMGATGFASSHEVTVSARYGPYVLGSLAHEFGHTFGARHAGSWECEGAAVGPNALALLEGCFPHRYGDRFSAMGSGNPYAFDSYHQLVLGVLEPERVATVTCSGPYEITALLSEAPGVQHLRLPIPEGPQAFFFLEYRRPEGIDAVLSDSGPADDIPDGVLVRLHADFRFPTFGDSDTLLIDRVVREGSDFVDPHRGLRVEFVERRAESAVVRVELPEADADRDGTCDAADPCPFDALDDRDGDGLCESVDNCPTLPNPDQADADGDGEGDVCECAGRAPPESGPRASLRVDAGGRLSWRECFGETEYRVFRGTIPRRGLGSRPEPYDHECWAVPLNESVEDGSAPPTGAAFYYLVVAANPCGHVFDAEDRSSRGELRPLAPCP